MTDNDVTFDEEAGTTEIILEGGGLLEDVDDIASIHVGPAEIEFKPISASTWTLSGHVRSHVQFRRKDRDDIDEETLKIPFSRDVHVERPDQIPPGSEARIVQIDSHHHFDPGTSQFQHRITLTVGLSIQSAVNDDGAPTSPSTENRPPSVPPKEHETPIEGKRPQGHYKKDEVAAEEKTSDEGEPVLPEHPAVNDEPPASTPPTYTENDEKEEPEDDDVLVWGNFPPPLK